MLQAGIQYNDLKPIPHWDKNGKIYYTDSQGNKIENQQPLLEQVGKNLKALATNANNWLNNSDPNSEAYKQKANIALALATMPIGAGAKITQAIAKPLVPYVGKKIATSVASGIGGSGLSGAVEGLGRGLIEQKNPLLTAAQDMVLGSVGGAIVGGAIGKVGKNIAKKSLAKNPVARNQYAQDYLEGLNKNKLSKELADYRGAVQNTFNGDRQTLNNFIGENAENIDTAKLEEAKQLFDNGLDNEAIRQQTGWFKGVDDKWRYEIPDGKLIEPLSYKENLKYFDWGDGDNSYVGLLPKIYDAPELYAAYPELKQTTFAIRDLPLDTVAQTGPDMGITANKHYFGLPSSDEAINHEVQHQIQMIEDFAQGGSTKSNNYKNLAGEVESRLVEQRFGLTPEQRLSTPIKYDVEPEKQIVEFSNDKNILYNKLTNNNGVVDLTNSFSKNPTIAEVKAHIQNLINNGIKYDTLSPDWKIDIIGGKAKADHIVRSSQYGKMNKSKVNRHNKYIASIEDLINNSTYSSSKANTKIAKKPNIDTYHYFGTNVKIGNKQYKVILNAEQFKGESTIKPQTVHLYDVLEIK